jgi:hypothetical protein
MARDTQVAVFGVCEYTGVLSIMYSDCNQHLWEVRQQQVWRQCRGTSVHVRLLACDARLQMAEHIGFEKLVLNHEDYDRSLDPQFGPPVDMSGVEVGWR